MLSTAPYIDFVRVNGSPVGLYDTADVRLNLGESFTFEVQAGNSGDDASPGYSQITFNFEQFDAAGDEARISVLSPNTDLDPQVFFGAEASGGDGIANWVMVEAYDTDGWDGSDGGTDEKNLLRVALQPKRYGEFNILG